MYNLLNFVEKQQKKSSYSVNMFWNENLSLFQKFTLCTSKS